MQINRKNIIFCHSQNHEVSLELWHTTSLNPNSPAWWGLVSSHEWGKRGSKIAQDSMCQSWLELKGPLLLNNNYQMWLIYELSALPGPELLLKVYNSMYRIFLEKNDKMLITVLPSRNANWVTGNEKYLLSIA